jgi:membrane protein involved in colicin uptake
VIFSFFFSDFFILFPKSLFSELFIVHHLVIFLFQRPPQRSSEARPVPDSTFLTTAQMELNPTSQPSSSTIRQGDLAQKLLQMQQEKNKANEDRKIALLEAKYAADLKKAEEASKKRLEKEKKKAEQAQLKAIEAAEKREKKRQEAELKKKAKAETKKIIAEVRHEISEKRKQEAALKKLEEKRLEAERRDAQRQAAKEAQKRQPEGADPWEAATSGQGDAALVPGSADPWTAAAHGQGDGDVPGSTDTWTAAAHGQGDGGVPRLPKKVSMFDELRGPRRSR